MKKIIGRIIGIGWKRKQRDDGITIYEGKDGRVRVTWKTHLGTFSEVYPPECSIDDVKKVVFI